MLHVWEFKDGQISRENVWLDGGAIVAQLTTPPHGGLRPRGPEVATAPSKVR
jgi:hypothetical protein